MERNASEIAEFHSPTGAGTAISGRYFARRLFEDGQFVEIHVDTPLEEAERRDVKGLYAKALSGEIKNFTGITAPYEEPENAELVLETDLQSPDDGHIR